MPEAQTRSRVDGELPARGEESFAFEQWPFRHAATGWSTAPGPLRVVRSMEGEVELSFGGTVALSMDADTFAAVCRRFLSAEEGTPR